MRTTSTVVLLATILSVVVLGADKKRDWIAGTVLQSGADRQVVTTGSRTTGTVTQNGDVDLTTRETRQRLDRYSYLVEGPTALYVISENIGRIGYAFYSVPSKKSFPLTPGQAIQYVIEKHSLIVLDSAGKEHKFAISEASLKPASGHAN